MTVIATLTNKPYESEVKVLDSGHVFIGDEPEALGGTNKGTKSVFAAASQFGRLNDCHSRGRGP